MTKTYDNERLFNKQKCRIGSGNDIQKSERVLTAPKTHQHTVHTRWGCIRAPNAGTVLNVNKLPRAKLKNKQEEEEKGKTASLSSTCPQLFAFSSPQALTPPIHTHTPNPFGTRLGEGVRGAPAMTKASDGSVDDAAAEQANDVNVASPSAVTSSDGGDDGAPADAAAAGELQPSPLACPASEDGETDEEGSVDVDRGGDHNATALSSAAASVHSAGRLRRPRRSPATAGARTPACLDVPARWAGSVAVDITGMDPEAVRMASRAEVAMSCGFTPADEGPAQQPHPGTAAAYNKGAGIHNDWRARTAPAAPRGLSLLDLNIANLTEDVVLQSPRSVQACLRLGVQPTELKKMPFEECLRSTCQSGSGGRPRQADVECANAKMRHLEERRMSRYYALLYERSVIADASQTFAAVGQRSGGAAASEMVVAEELKLKKLVDANQAMLRQRMAHEHRVQAVADERARLVAEQKARDASAKSEARRQEQLREEEQEIRQQLLKMKKSLEKREMEALMARRQRSHREKELQRRKEQRERKEALELQNRLKSDTAAERQRTIREYNHELEEDRRQVLLTRIEKSEQNKLETEKKRRLEVKRRKARMMLKQAKIQAALARSQHARSTKVEFALMKEEKAEEALRMFEQARDRLLDEKKDVDRDKRERRQRIYEEAQRLELGRKETIQEKQRLQEHHFTEMMQRRDEDCRVRHNVRSLKVQDKLDNVERMKKVTEYRKYLTVERIEAKSKKTADMDAERERLKATRKRHREAIEAARVPVKRHTPGPGNYLGLDAPEAAARSSPQWKFGVGAAYQAMRVVAPEKISKGVAPGYVSSPGPCAYAPVPVEVESSKRCMPAYTLSKATRFGLVRER